jgi:hypothetical protein
MLVTAVGGDLPAVFIRIRHFRDESASLLVLESLLPRRHGVAHRSQLSLQVLKILAKLERREALHQVMGHLLVGRLIPGQFAHPRRNCKTM